MQTFFITFDNTFEAANFKSFAQETAQIEIEYFNSRHCKLRAPNDTFASIAYLRGVLVNSTVKIKYTKRKITRYLTFDKSHNIRNSNATNWIV